MSNFGGGLALLAFYMIYLLIGGFIFYNIECPEEMAVKRRVVNLQRELMMLIIEGLEHIRDEEAPPDFAPFINRHINQMLEDRTYEEAKERYKVCETWGFFNSFFFAFTSVTTIGYGKISLQTQFGRVACLIYSIVGIPLNTIVISFIGNYLVKKGSE